MAALEYWLWLSAALQNPRAVTALLDTFGDAEAAYNAPEGAFAGIAGIGRSEAAALERRDLSLAGEIAEECERQGIRIISLQDAAYPAALRQIASPPAVLYVKGSLNALAQGVPVAVIGTRRGSVYGLRMAGYMGGELALCGAVLVSPLTSGIERAAAETALREGGKVIGVLGVPHERETRRLEADVAANGALISEYPPFTRPLNVFFRYRNRIASGLCAGVLVIEAPEKSGTALFVAEAAEQGKEIFAVPGNADAEGSAGTLRMIREGAKLVTDGWDVMSEFEALYPDKVHRAEPGRRPVPTDTPPAEVSRGSRRAETRRRSGGKPREEKAVDKPPEKAYIDLKEQLEGLTEPQLRIVAAIDAPSKHIDDIITATGLPTATVLAQMTVLTIKGYVRREPGMRFSLNITKK